MKPLFLSTLILLIWKPVVSQDVSYIRPSSWTNPTRNFDSRVRLKSESPLGFTSMWFINFTIKAEGLAVQNSFEYNINTYISVDSIKSNDDVFIQSNHYPGCRSNCNNTYASAFDISIPCNLSLADGAYYFILELDPDNSLQEINENNNIGYIGINYQNSSCGKVYANVLPFQTQYQPGDFLYSYDFKLSLNNQSSEEYNSINGVSFFLSKNLILDRSAVALQNNNLQTVFPRSASPKEPCPNNILTAPYSILELDMCQKASYRIPSDIPSGTYFILAIMGGYAPSYYKFSGNPINIGIITGMEQAGNANKTDPEIIRIYNLLGHEITEDQAEGQVVVAVFADQKRKVLFFRSIK